VQVVAGSLPVLPDLVLCAARVRVIPFAVTIGKAAGNLTRRHWQTTAALRQDGLVTSLTERVAAVVFDFYGTLTPVHPADRWADQLAALAAIVGVSPGALGVALRESYPERATGALGDLRQTLRTLASRLGVDLGGQRLEAACQLRREMQRRMLALRPEALPVITRLRARGTRTGVLSDCTSELPDAWPSLPLSGVIDAPVFSCVEGTRKPDPRLFRTVAARLGADPADCLYVGDGGGQELTGASAVGMHAMLLAGPDWHAHGRDDREAGWTGPRISSLSELCD
jgi:putative hydrolase of the HAD superfamily